MEPDHETHRPQCHLSCRHRNGDDGVEAFEGQVRSSGFVMSRADMDKAVAVAVAHDVSGVTSVDNGMRFEQGYPLPRPGRDGAKMKRIDPETKAERVPAFLVWIAGIAIFVFWAAEIAASMR